MESPLYRDLVGGTSQAIRRIQIASRAVATTENARCRHTGHIGQSSLKKQHSNACRIAGIEFFPLYTFRHTCLTLWSACMDPYTLAYFAGHSDFATTRRYVHPNLETGREAMERARGAQGGHNLGTVTDQSALTKRPPTAVTV